MTQRSLLDPFCSVSPSTTATSHHAWGPQQPSLNCTGTFEKRTRNKINHDS